MNLGIDGCEFLKLVSCLATGIMGATARETFDGGVAELRCGEIELTDSM